MLVELYADDALFFAGQSVSEIESRLSTDLDRLISWFRCNYLMLDVSRTKILLIGAHQRLNTVDSFSVVADNTFLERVYSFKYLGVTMDETFSWKEDVSLLGKKISSRLALLRPPLGESYLSLHYLYYII